MLINLFDVAVCWLVVANYIISYLYKARKRYRRGKGAGGGEGGGRVGGNGSDFFDCFAG